MTRVMVVATSAVIQAGLEAMLSRYPELQLVGTTSPLQDTFLDHIEVQHPDVVLIDDPEPESASLAALINLQIEAYLVVLLNDVQDLWVLDLLRLGVRGILSTESDAAEIKASIEAVASGLVTLPSESTEILLANTLAKDLLPAALQPLTPRELDVLTRLAEGLGNKSIAKQLQISEHTVKFHVGSILTKLNASSRTEAVTLAARQGLILL